MQSGGLDCAGQWVMGGLQGIAEWQNACGLTVKVGAAVCAGGGGKTVPVPADRSATLASRAVPQGWKTDWLSPQVLLVAEGLRNGGHGGWQELIGEGAAREGVAMGAMARERGAGEGGTRKGVMKGVMKGMVGRGAASGEPRGCLSGAWVQRGHWHKGARAAAAGHLFGSQCSPANMHKQG